MPKLKPKEGEYYLVDFFDHAKNCKEAMECRIVGKLIKEDKFSYLFRWWETYGPNDPDVIYEDSNHEDCIIIKSAILRIVRLSVGRG